MTDRSVAVAVAERLGPGALARLRRLRRRLWWRRAVRSGLLVIAAAVLAVAAIQLLARAFPLEVAPWVSGCTLPTVAFDGSAGLALRTCAR